MSRNKSRINLGKHNPEIYKAMFEFNKQVEAAMAPLDFQKGFVHLLKLRVSQINHCAFCCKMHGADALKAGEDANRLSTVVAWGETQYFTPKEQAALSLVESITLQAVDHVPDEVYDAAREKLSDDETTAVAWLAVLMNAWNRIAVTSRYPVGPDA